MATNNVINNYVGPITNGFTYFAAANGGYANNTWTTLLYDATPLFDIDSNLNNATGIYTVPSNGIYMCSASLLFEATYLADQIRFLSVAVERAASIIYRAEQTLMSDNIIDRSNNRLHLQEPIPVKTGDLVYVQFKVNSSNGGRTLAASPSNYWTFYKIGSY